jgi:hypothetical protein
VGQKWKVVNLVMNPHEMAYYMDSLHDFSEFWAAGISDFGGGQYEKLVYLCNIGPPTVPRAAIAGACRRVSGLRGMALCAPDRAH